MKEFANITDSISSLKIGDIDVLNNPSNPNLIDSTEIIWTNNIQWKTAEAKWSSIYKTTAPPNISYVEVFRVGIVAAKTSFKYISNEGNQFINSNNRRKDIYTCHFIVFSFIKKTILHR